MATEWQHVGGRKKKIAREYERFMVEARRLELLTLTLPA
jgi:hypothetical protein